MSNDANPETETETETKTDFAPMALVDEPLGGGLQIVFPLEEVYVERQSLTSTCWSPRPTPMVGRSSSTG